ncbi:hypothetical protein NEUTE1DRAFT_43839, partial [Neurospora tetrasperma FGSC 2508]
EATLELDTKSHKVSSFTSLFISELFISTSRYPTDLSSISKPQRGPQLFDTYNEPTTCISAEPHEQAVKDPVQHYFGCIEICQRPDFFKESNNVWVNEREMERKKLRMAMDNASRPLLTDDMNAMLNETMTKRMLSVAIAIEARYRRTEVMRSAIMKPRSSGGQPRLVYNMEKSRNKWMNSQKFKDGIPMVRDWRKGAQGGHRPVDLVNAGEFTLSDRIQTGRQEVQLFIRQHGINKEQNADLSGIEYSIERDVHAHFIEFTVQEANIQTTPGAESSSAVRQFLKPANDELADIGVKGTFPDQRISMSRLLNNGRDLMGGQCDPKDDWNILRRDRNEGFAKPRRIRYLHVPSNNMAKVIANYYADSNPDVRSKVQSPGIQSSTQLLLRPQYWHGQQQETRSGIVHTRHMRALCEIVSSNTDIIEQSPKNIVLFRINSEIDKAKQLRLQRLSAARPLTKHYAYDDHYGCEECRQNIMQVQRLIMVDQIWMWILDEQTIITSFPQSWRKNARQTVNGIHESIRARLRPLATTQIDHQIQSVYELGLLILGECSTLSDLSSLRLRLLDNTEEEKLQQELRQVLIDLDVMLDVQKQQDTFVRRFCQHAEKNLSGNQNKDKRLRFRGQSQNLLQKLGDQLSELERLQKWTKRTAAVINDLVNLKQQHASLIKAQESMRQADESTSQGRAVMMFTVVTIIFVPLSFISSIFGMNNIEFSGENPMSLEQQFGIIATLPLLLASTVVYLFTVVTVRLGLLGFWLQFHNKEHFQVNTLRNRIESEARQMRRVAENEARRKIREKEFAKRIEHKFEDARMDERPSRIDLILRRYPSLLEDDAGAFALEMGPVDAGRRIIDRRARGERAHAAIEEEERSRASQDVVQDRVH